MMNSLKRLKVDDSVKSKLISQLQSRANRPILFAEEPHLAALCTSLGLMFEMGRPNYDRLSVLVGIEEPRNPVTWTSEIVEHHGEVGVILTPPSSTKMLPMHEDLKFILSHFSIGDDGGLSRLVIFPNKVATHFASLGVHLMILPSWILSSALSKENHDRPYFIANTCEANQNIARHQLDLLTNHRLVFSGTHDIADHLLGFDPHQLGKHNFFFKKVDQFYRTIDDTFQKNSCFLLLSYLIGVLLDDLAQPLRYRSQDHLEVIERCMEQIRATLNQQVSPVSKIPRSFHKVIQTLRDKKDVCEEKLISYLEFFYQECRESLY